MASNTSPEMPAVLRSVGQEAVATQKGHAAEIALLVSVLLAACGHLFIKAGLNAAVVPGMQASLPEQLVRYLLAPMVILGLVVYAAGTAMWVVAVAKGDISYLFPVTAMNYVLLTLGGKWLFGEAVPRVRWLGILIVMLGVILMQLTAEGKKT